MKILTITLSISLLLLVFGCAHANNYQSLDLIKQTELPHRKIKPKALGIAFGGGGLRGYMHLGVIKALEKHSIKADFVTGSSAGSIAATLYASGKTYQDLEDTINGFSESKVLDFVFSTKGFVNGQHLAQWINDSVPQQKLSQMQIPIGITATDMTTLQSVLIQDGNPGEAVQTSSTIPGVFVPVEHNQHLLVDGGILNVVPVNYVEAMGADIVIAVDIYCGNQKSAKMSSVGIQLATFRLLACKLSEEEINSADIVIRPTYEPQSNGLFSSREEAVKAGYDAMLAEIPKLKALLQ